ncbi:MAG: S24 family peptidase [Burkholderiales bacterium]|nr:S24 family peptidase [Burkholderiales bacterium]
MSCGCRAGEDAAADDDDGCSGGESYALRVLGDAMAPEFNDGEIIVVEPDGALRDGSYVVARHEGHWIFRQLVAQGPGWALHALDGRHDDLPLPDLGAVHGVVIQKSVPGRRRLTRRYV